MEKYNVDISVYIAWMDIHPTEDSNTWFVVEPYAHEAT